MRRSVILVAAVAVILTTAVPALAVPVNDDLGDASAVTALAFSDSVDASDATVEPGEPVDGDDLCPPRSSTVWYEVTLETSQQVAIDTSGSDYDTTLAIYTGSDYGDLSLVDCNDDTFFGVQAALSFAAEAGVTYLVQVGSFGDGPAGMLQVSFDEPGKTTGKPIILKSHFRGSSADAIIEEFDEATGAFSFTGVFLIDGRSQSGGKPSKFSSLFVSTFEESFDEVEGTFTFTEWFGVAELSKDQFAINKKLTSASVLADVTLQGQTCTGTFEDEEPECTDLGLAEVMVDVSWEGTGGIEKSQFMEKGSSEGVRFMFRGKTSTRSADVEGGVSGDLVIDLSDAFGSLTTQTTGDFIMIRGASIP